MGVDAGGGPRRPVVGAAPGRTGPPVELSGHGVPRSRRPPAVEGAAPPRRRRRRDGARGRGPARRDSPRNRRPRRPPRPLRHRRHLPRHPARAVPARHRRTASRPRPAPRRPRGGDGGDAARPGARRRQPQEHPRRAPWPGVPRRRVRVVRRPRVRRRLLPEPPAAQVPVDAGRDARLPLLFRRTGGRLPGRRGLGAARAPGGAGGGSAARPAAGPGRREVAGRVPDHGRGPGPRAGGGPSPARGAGRGPGRGAGSLGVEPGPRVMPARVPGFPGRRCARQATRARLHAGRRPGNDRLPPPHRPSLRSPGLGLPRPPHRRGRDPPARRRPGGAPSPRPARRPAAARPSTCATAAPPSADTTSPAPSGGYGTPSPPPCGVWT